MQKILTKQTEKGIQIFFRNKSYELSYPKKIWCSYPHKKDFINNFVPLVTLSLPLMLRIKKIYYNTARPFFEEKFRQLMLKDLPSSTYDYNQNAVELAKNFLKIKYFFEARDGYKSQANEKTKNKENEEHKAIVSLSFGKDSLLSFALAKEIGLEPISLYINDTVSPSENTLKLKMGRRFAKEFKQTHYVVTNNIERLNDYDEWNTPETSINYVHMVTGFCFIALPFVSYHNLIYIVVGNEQNMNFGFRSKQNKLTYPSYDQTSQWQAEQNKMIKKMTANKTKVISLIRPLTSLAIIKILHSRYPEIAKYEISCDSLDCSNEKRWCHACNKCARLFLFMKAFGINTKSVRLRNMFEKKHKKFFCLFKGKKVDRYDQSTEAREQQLLAFLLATRNDAKGYLIDYFKKHYLKEALEKEEQLRKKYFRLWPAKIPSKLKAKVLSIYKEEFNQLR